MAQINDVIDSMVKAAANLRTAAKLAGEGVGLGMVPTDATEIHQKLCDVNLTIARLVRQREASM